MNTNKNITRRLDLVNFKILAFRNALKSTKRLRFRFFFQNALRTKQDTLVPLPHGRFSLLSLLNVLSGGKMDSIFLSPLENFQKS